jgi:8-oxo-dGTP diphosphatase
MTALHSEPGTEPMRLLVRHADAGSRRAWVGPDGWRHLSMRGREQANHLVPRLHEVPVRRLLSGPSLRCRQTLAPLARALSLDIEICPLLRIDAEPGALARYLRRPDTRNAVLCTYRQTLLALFTLYAATGSRYIEGIAPMGMAASWVLHGGEDGPPRVRYLRPDAVLVGKALP